MKGGKKLKEFKVFKSAQDWKIEKIMEMNQKQIDIKKEQAKERTRLDTLFNELKQSYSSFTQNTKIFDYYSQKLLSIENHNLRKVTSKKTLKQSEVNRLDRNELKMVSAKEKIDSSKKSIKQGNKEMLHLSDKIIQPIVEDFISVVIKCFEVFKPLADSRNQNELDFFFTSNDYPPSPSKWSKLSKPSINYEFDSDSCTNRTRNIDTTITN